MTTRKQESKLEEKQQSPNWEKYGVRNEIPNSADWPFRERFPDGGEFGNAGKKYDLIVFVGLAPRIKTIASLDYSRQYSVEGIQWMEVLNRDFIPKERVLGWRER